MWENEKKVNFCKWKFTFSHWWKAAYKAKEYTVFHILKKIKESEFTVPAALMYRKMLDKIHLHTGHLQSQFLRRH